MPRYREKPDGAVPPLLTLHLGLIAAFCQFKRHRVPSGGSKLQKQIDTDTDSDSDLDIDIDVSAHRDRQVDRELVGWNLGRCLYDIVP